MNAQALDHKGTMVDVYSKMRPDSFKSQLQAVLTANYKDIHGVQGASGCPKTSTRLSSASLRTKRRPEQRQTIRRLRRRCQRCHPHHPAARERGIRRRQGGASSSPHHCQ